MFDPIVRDFISYYFLQHLRQNYYHNGYKSGCTTKTISYHVRKLLTSTDWTEDQLNKYSVDQNMMLSIAMELENEGLIEYFVETKKEGCLGFKKSFIEKYRILESGMNYIKKAHPPNDPISNL